jgi:hypothetical protein
MVDENDFPNLSDETDIDLLVIISSFRDEDVELSNKAFEHFVKRYEEFIWKSCEKLSFGHYNLDSRELYSLVLYNICHYCGSFLIEKENDQGVIKKRICGWILEIIKNALLSIITPNAKIIFINEITKCDKRLELQSGQSKSISNNEKAVHQAFELLSERDRDILVTYWRYYEKGSGTQAKNLPTEVLRELENLHQTTSVNIRQIISRGNAKVIKYLKDKHLIQTR